MVFARLHAGPVVVRAGWADYDKGGNMPGSNSWGGRSADVSEAVVARKLKHGCYFPYGRFMHVSSKTKQKQDALSDPKREEEWGGEYGPYILNRFTKSVDGNCRIFYTLSTWNPYQVMIMQTDLKVPER